MIVNINRVADQKKVSCDRKSANFICWSFSHNWLGLAIVADVAAYHHEKGE